MKLVIVESPAKAKTIAKYLGKDYKVLASYGHVRDLPSKNGSVDPDDDFAMRWDVDSKSKLRIKDIERELKDADTLILATDPDREGEAISWHLLEVLNKDGALEGKKVQRVVFNAITKQSVTEAIAHPRDLDMELVNAYLARRALDYLVGFNLSPVLWRKLPGARSAGRVQSVALRLICERETEIEQFKPQEYWSIDANMLTAGGEPYLARLTELNEDKLDKFSLANEDAAMRAKAAIEKAKLSIVSVEAKPVKRRPYAPFTTSTLQQDASRKLGFSATRTMQTAQRLYEGVDIGGETVGLITYMRTDGISMVGEAITEARKVIGDDFGQNYVPKSPRVFKNKAKNAQEAHEAIRPTSFARHPDRIKLTGDQAKLYELIWKRAMASQMEDAELERTTIEIADNDNSVGLRATGSVMKFDGFLKLYEQSKSVTDEEEEDSALLPPVKAGEDTKADQVNAEQHFTQPPPRYSEASLVRKMEELGIGRPSTYASILRVLQDRDYVELDKRRFIPSDKGRLVTSFLENFFPKYVQYDYTADLEDRLDRVSSGDLEWKTLLRDFWSQFSAAIDDTKELRVSNVLDALNDALSPVVFPPKDDGTDPRACPSCADGELSLKIGKYGAFVGCSNYPDCKYTRPFGETQQPANQNAEDEVLGIDPETGMEVYLKSGRFGPYVQLGDEAKPKRTGLPKDWPIESIDLERALKLLSLPRDIGPHPEDGKMITGGLGRYGAFILHDGTYVNLPSVQEMFDIGLNRAVTLLAEKKENGGRSRRGGTVLKDLGAHPETGKPVQVMDGRYGPYIKYEKVNATLPKDTKPEDVTMEQALTLIAEKQAKGSSKKSARKKTPAKKKASAKS